MEDVICPGCHMGCFLSSPGCGRGMHFAEMLAAGEPLPQRRMPPGGRNFGSASSRPPEIPHAHGTSFRFPADSAAASSRESDLQDKSEAAPSSLMQSRHAVMLMSRIIPQAFRAIDGLELDDADNILIWVMRQEKLMARSVMSERTQIPEYRIDPALDYLLSCDALRLRRIDGQDYFEITDCGQIWAAEAQRRQDEAIEGAVGSLCDEELETLVGLCHKILDAIE